MKAWEYDIASYSTEDIFAQRAKQGQPAGDKEPVFYCNSDGMCFFDNMPNANTQAIVKILNERGVQGWRLCSVTFRGNEMLCFWMRKVEKD